MTLKPRNRSAASIVISSFFAVIISYIVFFTSAFLLTAGIEYIWDSDFLYDAFLILFDFDGGFTVYLVAYVLSAIFAYCAVVFLLTRIKNNAHIAKGALLFSGIFLSVLNIAGSIYGACICMDDFVLLDYMHSAVSYYKTQHVLWYIQSTLFKSIFPALYGISFVVKSFSTVVSSSSN